MVCRKFFENALSIGGRTLNRISASVRAGNPFPYNSNAKATKAETQKSKAVAIRRLRPRRETFGQWLVSFARKEGLPCPTGRGSRDDKPVLRLPAKHTKLDLWHIYRAAMVADGIKPFTYATYCRYWKRYYSGCCNKLTEQVIVISSKKTDFCNVCQKLYALGNNPAFLAAHLEHYQIATVERTMNKRNIKRAIKERGNTCVVNGILNVPTYAHASFDFAEKAMLPTFYNQPNKNYFETGLKCDINGVCRSDTATQFNYFLQEGRVRHWSWHLPFTLAHLRTGLYWPRRVLVPVRWPVSWLLQLQWPHHWHWHCALVYCSC